MSECNDKDGAFNVDVLQILADDRSLITYRPKLNQITGGMTATILLQQILYWWEKSGRIPFYKFKEPCEHKLYRKGDSWCEELGFSRAEFDTALSKIGCKTSKKKSMQEDKFVRYWITPDRLTHYDINVAALRAEIMSLYVSPHSYVTCSDIPSIESTTETTSKTISETTSNKKASTAKNLSLESTERKTAKSIPLSPKPPFSKSKYRIPCVLGKNSPQIKTLNVFTEEIKKTFSLFQSPKKVGEIQRWAMAMGDVLEDGHEPETIMKAVKFALEDGFWADKIIDPWKLRKNINAVLAAMPREKKPGEPYIVTRNSEFTLYSDGRKVKRKIKEGSEDDGVPTTVAG